MSGAGADAACAAEDVAAAGFDGRGAGLRAIDVEVKDKGAVLVAAERHGLAASDSTVSVCGTDINLV